VVFIAVAQDPVALAERLQLPHQHQQMLRQLGELRYRLTLDGSPEGQLPRSAWQWSELLEAPGLTPQAVALALASGLGPRRPLLRWYLRWRHIGPDVSALALMASGVSQGPQLGVELRRSREKRLKKERP
jgi:poly(A) polymerase